MKNQSGQVILILILVMTVGLGIGLSMVQKSLVDVSTASKVEQSSRAFSAAEAGVEKALRGDTSKSFASTTSQITELSATLIPAIADSGVRQDPLYLAPLYKEDMAQVWLADYTSISNPPPVGYAQDSLNVYWGDSVTDKAAIVLTLVYYDGTVYKSKKWYLDPDSSRSGPAGNGFKNVTCTGSYDLAGYRCRVRLGDASLDPYYASPGYGPLPVTGLNRLIAIRVRLLYNSTPQPVAFWATSATCGLLCSLPSQSKLITSTGVSGETQRRISLFQLFKIVPPYFDYAIFSAGEIKKQE